MAPEPASDGDFFLFRVLDREVKGEISGYGGGAIGGRVGERPTLLRHFHTPVNPSFVVGPPGFVEYNGGIIKLSSWTDPSKEERIWTSADENGLGQWGPFFVGDTLFWSSESAAIKKEKVWTRAAGVKDFLGSSTDTSTGIADLGGDGNDLVWVAGSNRTSASGPFPNVAVRGSAYVTDPAKVNARTLRTDVTGYPFGASRFVVGCGYAARQSFFPSGDDFVGAILVVRLADGMSWRLPVDDASQFSWQAPLALTCDELFARVRERPSPTDRPRFSVARVRLDSLGPGLPP